MMVVQVMYQFWIIMFAVIVFDFTNVLGYIPN